MSIKRTLEDFINSLKNRFNEAPEQVLLAGAAIMVASAKIIDATSGAQSKRAYARKMNQSIRRNR